MGVRPIIMTLSEIETILEQLVVRHPNLDTILLTTLLSSAGWEEKRIKEATVLFSQRKQIVQNIHVPLKQNVAAEVQQQTAIATVDSVKKEESEPQKEFIKEVKQGVVLLEKEETILVQAPVVEALKVEPVVEQVVEQVLAAIPSKEKEPESLIVHEEISMRRNQERDVEIPGNLPLLPFESSPHIWSFSKYKDMFHKDTPYKEEIQLITVMPQEEKSSQQSSVKVSSEAITTTSKVFDEEVSLVKSPMTKGDESLVFLAGMMLFVIILILGYMYSNGRL